MTRPTASAGAARSPTAARGREAKARRTASPSANAQRGAEVAVVREAGPQAVAQLFAQFEARGELAAEDDTRAGEQDFDLLPPSDAEIDQSDEDAAPVEAWHRSGDKFSDAVSLGESAGLSAVSPFADRDAYELIVADGRCSFNKPAWAASCKAASLRASQCLNEASTRFRTYKALAEWLTRERGAFLKSRDWWDLGPANSSELKQQRCSVLQKDLLRMLGLSAGVIEESFSRFINRCELVWPDGAAPVRILFSREASLAWAARAVACFAADSGEPLTEETLDKYLDIKMPKRKAAAPLEHPDFRAFVERVIKKAGVKWKDVLEAYRSRMIQYTRDHAQENIQQ